MKTSLRSRLVLGAAAAVVVLGAAAYACKGFLDTPAQGTLDVNALTSKIGVEGALIATYRTLDCTNATLRLRAKVSAAKPGEISRTDSAGIAGEAICLRAHFRFELWRMWGNVPYYVETDTLD